MRDVPTRTYVRVYEGVYVGVMCGMRCNYHPHVIISASTSNVRLVLEASTGMDRCSSRSTYNDGRRHHAYTL